MQKTTPFLLVLLATCGTFVSGCGPEETEKDSGQPVVIDVDADHDGVLQEYDCDDDDRFTYPGAPEICDGKDNDCDDQVDEGVQEVFYSDADGDGFGDPDSPVLACEPGQGLVADSNDCDDSDPERNPSAAETCDGLDNNCNGAVDEGMDDGPWYLDADSDGHGDPEVSVEDCEIPTGYVEAGDDCDDSQPDVFPGNEEHCDGLDNDCDLAVDEYDAVDIVTWYADADSDGYGNPDEPLLSCEPPEGYVLDDGDCDDSRADVNPGATEVCDEYDTDENCNGYADSEDSTLDESGMVEMYPDADGDGFGDPAAEGLLTCEGAEGMVFNDYDCDDGDASIVPDTWYLDADGDEYGDPDNLLYSCEVEEGRTTRADDCDDGDALINPDVPEICENGVDEDCDGRDNSCLYTFEGIATDLDESELEGWELCYSDYYNESGTEMETILGACYMDNLLLACAEAGSSTLIVAAHGPRDDVTYDTGIGDYDTTHEANGVAWYYAASDGGTGAWGYIEPGDDISKSECDTADGSYPERKLCWHTRYDAILYGWRCGRITDLNTSSAYERLIYQGE